MPNNAFSECVNNSSAFTIITNQKNNSKVWKYGFIHYLCSANPYSNKTRTNHNGRISSFIGRSLVLCGLALGKYPIFLLNTIK